MFSVVLNCIRGSRSSSSKNLVRECVYIRHTRVPCSCSMNIPPSWTQWQPPLCPSSRWRWTALPRHRSWCWAWWESEALATAHGTPSRHRTAHRSWVEPNHGLVMKLRRSWRGVAANARNCVPSKWINKPRGYEKGHWFDPVLDNYERRANITLNKQMQW